jgi:hypothetical protein
MSLFNHILVPLRITSAYRKDSFQQMSWNIVEEEQIGDAEWTVEYRGQMQGNDFHFYARAVAKDGRVYPTTATAKESQWSLVSEPPQAR